MDGVVMEIAQGVVDYLNAHPLVTICIVVFFIGIAKDKKV